MVKDITRDRVMSRDRMPASAGLRLEEIDGHSGGSGGEYTLDQRTAENVPAFKALFLEHFAVNKTLIK